VTAFRRAPTLRAFALALMLTAGAEACAFPAVARAAAHSTAAARRAAARARARAHARRGSATKAAAAKPVGAPVAQTLRTYTGPNSTRIVLELSRSATFRIEPDSASRSFAVLVPGGVRSPALAATFVADGAVDSLTFDERADGFRLVVHVAQWYPPRVFGLDGESGDAARIVVDVVRPGQEQRDIAERARVDALAKTAHRIVVIDPGHGGEAVGAVGPRHTYEKDVTLAIAQRLKSELEKNPGIQAVLTRTGDYDVPLRERYKVAERYQADAFVSIHCNSSTRRNKGEGTEVYFLSLESASDEASKNLADVENAADRISAGPQSAGDDDLVGILYDLKANESMQQSSKLAEAILNEIESGRRLTSRGLHQAGFAVLKSPVVPSVLVETAFINNPSEERLLKDPEFQQEMAEEIARGLSAYLATAPIAPRGATNAPGSPPPAHLGVSR
jgi:N-acetylmuramoyl-L-alanine amidase